VSDNNVHGALALGTIFLLAGMSLIATLHFLAVKDRAALLQRA